DMFSRPAATRATRVCRTDLMNSIICIALLSKINQSLYTLMIPIAAEGLQGPKKNLKLFSGVAQLVVQAHVHPDRVGFSLWCGSFVRVCHEGVEVMPHLRAKCQRQVRRDAFANTHRAIAGELHVA